ncbi:helix-turn-helix domain-containing protein [Shimazuella alba]|uniref:Helix-turn-helix domain-containing protein n=1 Tax=Shimazuella alba TaxID=2690964 RepID=A0A6I4W1U8_9BACL|nr:helix-turn-helix transcriptional regulator [Shimazuella alba]MXQ54744.1 helix-turn-helix domain-containing protein [Shimazuella alba]
MKTSYLEKNADLISYLIRKERSARGWRLEDLADKTVSVSTISNMENQTAPVKEIKIIHIIEKLGISKKELPKRIEAATKEIKKYQNSLKLIEAMLNGQSLSEAKEKIDRFSLAEYHPLHPLVLYFRAYYHYYKREYEIAEETLHHTMSICKQYHLNPKPNFLSDCFCLLSSSSYKKNNIEKALILAEQGLNQLNETIPHNKVKYMLLGNKIIFLEKQGENAQALQLVRQVWNSIQQVESHPVKLNFYKSKANLLLKGNQLEDAIYFALKGFEIAQSNPWNRFTFDFLMILGLIYLQQKNYDAASEYFHTVICLDKNIQFPRRHVDAYTNLAILYNSQQNWALTNDYVTKAIQIGRDIKDIYRLTKALIVNGYFYQSQHQTNEAIPLYTEAYSLAKANRFKHRQFKALFHLLECHDILKNEQEFIHLNKELFYLQKEMDWKGDDDIYVIA